MVTAKMIRQTLSQQGSMNSISMTSTQSFGQIGNDNRTTKVREFRLRTAERSVVLQPSHKKKKNKSSRHRKARAKAETHQPPTKSATARHRYAAQVAPSEFAPPASNHVYFDTSLRPALEPFPAAVSPEDAGPSPLSPVIERPLRSASAPVGADASRSREHSITSQLSNISQLTGPSSSLDNFDFSNESHQEKGKSKRQEQDKAKPSSASQAVHVQKSFITILKDRPVANEDAVKAQGGPSRRVSVKVQELTPRKAKEVEIPPSPAHQQQRGSEHLSTIAAVTLLQRARLRSKTKDRGRKEYRHPLQQHKGFQLPTIPSTKNLRFEQGHSQPGSVKGSMASIAGKRALDVSGTHRDLTDDGQLQLPLSPLQWPYRLEERMEIIHNIKRSLLRLQHHMKKNRLRLDEFFKGNIDRNGNVPLDDVYYFFSHIQRSPNGGAEEAKADGYQLSENQDEEPVSPGLSRRRDKLTPAMIQKVIEFVDPNGDGMIEMEELEQAFKKAKRYRACRREHKEKRRQEFFEKSTLLLNNKGNFSPVTNPEDSFGEESDTLAESLGSFTIGEETGLTLKVDMEAGTSSRFGPQSRQQMRHMMTKTAEATKRRIEKEEIQRFCSYLALWADEQGIIELNVLNDRINWLREFHRKDANSNTLPMQADVATMHKSMPELPANALNLPVQDPMNVRDTFTAPVMRNLDNDLPLFNQNTLKPRATTTGEKVRWLAKRKTDVALCDLRWAASQLNQIDQTLQKHRHTRIMTLIRQLDRSADRCVRVQDLEHTLTESLSDLSHSWVRNVLSDTKRLIEEEEEFRRKTSEEDLHNEAVETMRNGVAFALSKLELLMKSKNLRLQDLFHGQLVEHKHTDYITPTEFKAALNRLLLPRGYAEAQYMREKRLAEKKKKQAELEAKKLTKEEFLQRMKRMEESGLANVFSRIDKYCCRFQMRVNDIFQKADFSSEEDLILLLTDPTRLALPEEEVEILLHYLLDEEDPSNKHIFDPSKLQDALNDYRRYKRAKKNLLRSERRESNQLLTDRQVITLLRYLIKASFNEFGGYTIPLDHIQSAIESAHSKSINKYFKELREQKFPDAIPQWKDGASHSRHSDDS